MSDQAKNGQLEDRPHARRGRLRNGNPGGDLSKVARCGSEDQRGGPRAGRRRCPTVGAACTAASAPDPGPRKGWRDRARATGNMGSTPPPRSKGGDSAGSPSDGAASSSRSSASFEATYRLLFKIAAQIDQGRSNKALRSKCSRALPMFERLLEVLAARPRVADDTASRRTDRKSQAVLATLRAGAQGATTHELRKILLDTMLRAGRRNLVEGQS